MISAKIIADSKNEFGNRITTMVVTMPRFILAEFNTHRMFSRNSASSRAIPFEKMLKSVEENPFIPIAWQKDHKGMQGTEYFDTDEIISFIDRDGVGDTTTFTEKWLEARDHAVTLAHNMSNSGLTKQLCNRLLEPFMWHTVICTSTEWENFFALRCPQYEVGRIMEFDIQSYDPTSNSVSGKGSPEYQIWRSKKQATKEWGLLNTTDEFWRGANKGQAEIHMMALAEAMWDAYNESTPKELKAGEWHIPFGDNIDIKQLDSFYYEKCRHGYKDRIPMGLPTLDQMKEEINELKIKIATARCARVSYTVVGEEGKADNYENDIKLHDRLASSGHWSPFEHCAKTMNKEEYESLGHDQGGFGLGEEAYLANPGWSGNFRGFVQYRKTFSNENITK